MLPLFALTTGQSQCVLEGHALCSCNRTIALCSEATHTCVDMVARPTHLCANFPHSQVCISDQVWYLVIASCSSAFLSPRCAGTSTLSIRSAATGRLTLYPALTGLLSLGRDVRIGKHTQSRLETDATTVKRRKGYGES